MGKKKRKNQGHAWADELREMTQEEVLRAAEAELKERLFRAVLAAPSIRDLDVLAVFGLRVTLETPTPTGETEHLDALVANLFEIPRDS